MSHDDRLAGRAPMTPQQPRVYTSPRGPAELPSPRLTKKAKAELAALRDRRVAALAKLFDDNREKRT